MVSPICASLTVLMPAKMNPTSPTPSESTATGFGREHADLIDFVLLAPGHQADLHARADDAVEHAGEDDHAAVGVVPRVEDQRLQGRLRLALRRGQPLHDRFENLVDAGAFLGAREDRAAGVEADDLLDLPLGLVRLRARQIDLVDHRDDVEAVVHREVGVGEGLRFDALRRVDEEQRPFAGGERAGHFVREVDVPGRVDQVEDVDLAVVGLVGQADGVGLDGDAPLALEVHRVEDLRLHLARLQRAGHLEKAIGERRLAVVDVGDDGEITDLALVH